MTAGNRGGPSVESGIPNSPLRQRMDSTANYNYDDYNNNFIMNFKWLYHYVIKALWAKSHKKEHFTRKLK